MSKSLGLTVPNWAQFVWNVRELTAMESTEPEVWVVMDSSIQTIVFRGTCDECFKFIAGVKKMRIYQSTNTYYLWIDEDGDLIASLQIEPEEFTLLLTVYYRIDEVKEGLKEMLQDGFFTATVLCDLAEVYQVALRNQHNFNSKPRDFRTSLSHWLNLDAEVVYPD